MNKVGISTGFSLRETPGSVLAQIVLVQAMSVHYRPPKCPQGEHGPESISRWMEMWVHVCRRPTPAGCRGESFDQSPAL